MILDRHYIQDHSHKLLNVYPSMCLHTLPKLPLLPQFRILFFSKSEMAHIEPLLIFNLSINIHQLARNLWFVSPISSRGEKKLNTIITTTFLNNLGNAMFGTITFVVKLSSECTIVKKRIISSSVTSNSWTKMFIVQYLSPVHNKHPLCPNHLAKTKLKIQKMQIKNK